MVRHPVPLGKPIKIINPGLGCPPYVIAYYSGSCSFRFGKFSLIKSACFCV
jgi:hypothetical protein